MSSEITEVPKVTKTPSPETTTSYPMSPRIQIELERLVKSGIAKDLEHAKQILWDRHHKEDYEDKKS